MEIMKLLQFLTGFLLYSDYGNFPLLGIGVYVSTQEIYRNETKSDRWHSNYFN